MTSPVTFQKSISTMLACIAHALLRMLKTIIVVSVRHNDMTFNNFESSGMLQFPVHMCEHQLNSHVCWPCKALLLPYAYCITDIDVHI